eukprot:Nitzschia sp. Nitz4//scaffold61_size107673//7552//8274//NITZ4_004220-RA/size107673-processed-gene-0.150-mRNA-1//1//CDS//3329555665//6456//frame0
MKFTSLVSFVLLLSQASAFVVLHYGLVSGPSGLAMSETTSAPVASEPVASTPSPVTPDSTPVAAEKEGPSLVPIKEETIEFTAGILGGIAGFALGGPVGSALGATVANFVSKKEGEAAEVVGAVSKSTIEVCNYASKVENKYDLLNKARSAIDTLKAQNKAGGAVIQKVEDAVTATTNKMSEINDEYDVVGTSVTALGVFGDFVEKTVKRVSQLDEDYKITERATEAVKSAIDKTKAPKQ